VIAGLVLSGTAAAGADLDRALLDKYCVTCHNAKLKTGGLALDTPDLAEVPQHGEVWEKVVRKLRAGMMPPVGRPRPDKAAADALVGQLVTALDIAANATPNPGRTDALRRLNRTEYHNVIRDLLALDIDVNELLPADDSSNGFDNISLGGLDPGRLERYLAAAQKVSRIAVGAPMRSPVGDTIILPSDLPQNEYIDGLPFGTRGGTTFRYNFPLDAQYEFKMKLGRGFSGNQIVGVTEPHEIGVWVDDEQVQRFTVNPLRRRAGTGAPDPTGTQIEEGDENLHVRVPVKAGPHRVAVAFISKGDRLNEKQREAFLRVHVAVGEDQRTQPTLYSVTVVGPFDPQGPGVTPSRARIFACHPAAAAQESSCAKRIISTLARRAYRRPVTEADLKVLLAFYDEGRKADGSGSFESGIEMALRRLLVSPEFLFRIERDPENAKAAYRLSDLELASRLSFFLWSSIPDDALIDLASRGQLKTPAVLEKQVQRMLADPKSETLVTSFAAQWLYLRNLPALRPDANIFPDFDESLRQAFRQETELFFSSIIREDRPVTELLTANYSFINERLARHYGLPGVYGSQFRRVTFPADSPRGGLLGQGAILLATAYPNRTSPVIRGKWILQNILGTPPPPPPPNVPPLKETKTEQVMTMRERMVEHRRNPVCASCHAMMDPIGLSMENFDATGQWRTRSEALQPLDVSGGLPDGATFEGIAGLKAALVARSDQFVTTLTEKLLIYALGRPIDYYDAPAVRKIVRDASPGQYRFSSLILGIVKSTPFQMKNAGPAPALTVAAR
jgi:hypothetical protein